MCTGFGSATVTSSLIISWSTRLRSSSNSSTLDAQRSSCAGNPTSPTFARVTTVRPSCSLVPPSTRAQSTCGQLARFSQSCSSATCPSRGKTRHSNTSSRFLNSLAPPANGTCARWAPHATRPTCPSSARTRGTASSPRAPRSGQSISLTACFVMTRRSGSRRPRRSPTPFSRESSTYFKTLLRGAAPPAAFRPLTRPGRQLSNRSSTRMSPRALLPLLRRCQRSRRLSPRRWPTPPRSMPCSALQSASSLPASPKSSDARQRPCPRSLRPSCAPSVPPRRLRAPGRLPLLLPSPRSTKRQKAPQLRSLHCANSSPSSKKNSTPRAQQVVASAPQRRARRPPQSSARRRTARRPRIEIPSQGPPVGVHLCTRAPRPYLLTRLLVAQPKVFEVCRPTTWDR
mmetsp:Transcript_21802/g.66176  ORF Transcript_21802/g.66176 Transcript_21802/m.66176 type:complete len:400 (-) Transcript_21802:745-1944(-)